jgi:hypothetical protein
MRIAPADVWTSSFIHLPRPVRRKKIAGKRKPERKREKVNTVAV